jgi:hypothetical protein
MEKVDRQSKIIDELCRRVENLEKEVIWKKLEKEEKRMLRFKYF